MKKLLIMIVIFFVIVLGIFVVTRVREELTADSSAPVITADSDAITVSVSATDEDLLAGMTAVDNLDGDVTDTLVVVSKSKFITKGTLRVNYAAFDNNNNVGVYTREVTFSDYHPPRYSIRQPLRFLSANSDNDYLQYITAEDCLDGNITQQIRITYGDTTVIDETTSVQSANLLVTNSAGDNSVLTIQVRLEEYSTYNIQAPALTNYLLYVKAGTRPNLRDNLFGVWISGRATPFRDTRFNPNTDVKIDDSGVFYSMPGIYTAYYSLSESLKDGSRRDLGTAELMIIVEE